MFNPLTVSKILEIAQTHNEEMAKSLQKKIILAHYANRCFTQKMKQCNMCQNHWIISIPLSLRDNESKRGTKAQPEAIMILHDQQFSRMLGPWLQPPIHADTRSPSSLASPGPAIEFAVLPCAELGIAVEHLLGGAWVGHPHDMPQPSYPASFRHRQDARSAVQLSKLVVHPSPLHSMLEHTAKDGPEDVSLKHAQSVCILCMVQLYWCLIGHRPYRPGRNN